MVGHPLGPGTPTNPTIGFNFHYNELVYQKLESATRRGPALIQVDKGAKNDGWYAWRNLLNRYDYFTPKDIDATLKKLEALQHSHNTKIALGLYKFDFLVG